MLDKNKLISLTPKQKKILDFINIYISKKDFSPTLEEISKAFKKTVPTIHKAVKILEEKGYLKTGSGARNISIVSREEKPVQSQVRTFDIGIVGYGIVGQAVHYGFSRANVHIYDKYKETESLEEVVKNYELIFICFPTPTKSDESGIDLSIIDENLEVITKIAKGTDKIIIIKSTVTPGTTEKYMKKYPDCLFCFNPEFLRESSFLQDFIHTDRIVLGTKNGQVSRRITSLYQSIMPSIPVYGTDPTSAEMVKFTANCYLATKVIFANEMYDICQKLGVKYEEVKKIVVIDSRIGDSHMDVTTLRGFGGKCFPKDLLSLRALAKSKKVDTKLLDAVWAKNIQLRKVRDWEEIPFAIKDKSFGRKS